MCIDADGRAWIFGRNGAGCLGLGEGASKVEGVSENAPVKLTVADLEGKAKGGDAANKRFVHAATGRNHTLLVTSSGEVWSAGTNPLGQCGHPPCAEITHFKRIQGFGPDPNEHPFGHAVKAAAGISFSLVSTDSGSVYSFGSGEHGQLGNGTTGERITTGNKVAFDVEHRPVHIRFPLSNEKDKSGEGNDGEKKIVKIVDITCGQQHSVAVDEAG